MFAKVKDSILLKYPYDFSDLLSENPYTNYGLSNDVASIFPSTEAALLHGCELAEVRVSDTPAFDSKTHKIDFSAPILADGRWVIQTTVVEKSQAEISAESAAEGRRLRDLRNSLLAKSDWTQLADAPGDKTAWASYRQALRDVPLQEGFPWAITWPEEP
jgi:hypothetical protein